MAHDGSQVARGDQFLSDFAAALGVGLQGDRLAGLCEALRAAESAAFVLLLGANEGDPVDGSLAPAGDDTEPGEQERLPRDFTVLALAEYPPPENRSEARLPADSLVPVTPFLMSVLGSDGPVRCPEPLGTTDLSPQNRITPSWIRDGGLDTAAALCLGGTSVSIGWRLASPGGGRRGILLVGANPEEPRSDAPDDVHWAPSPVHLGVLLDRLTFELEEDRGTPDRTHGLVDRAPTGQAMDLGHLTERLRASEARYRRFIGSTSESIWCLEPDRPIPTDIDPGEFQERLGAQAMLSEGNLTFARRFGRLSTIGLRPAELDGFWLLADPHRLGELARNSFFAQDLVVTETDEVGQPRYLSCGLFGVTDAKGLRAIWAIERDVTGQIREAQRLRQSQEFYKAISETALDGICVLDGELSLVDCNDAFAGLALESREALLDRGTVLLTPVSGLKDAPVTFGAIKEQGRWRGEAILKRPGRTGDDQAIRVELACRFKTRGTPRFYCFVRDLSERQSAVQRDNDHQQALAHVARLSTLGEMTSGIAHELNQPLAAIVNYANGCTRILETEGLTNPMVFRGLTAITEQGERAANIIRRMRSFAVREGDTREPFAVEDILTEAIEMCLPDLNKAGVTVETDFGPERHVANVDGIQIEQVTINLIRNAIEAFAAGAAQGSDRPPEPGERKIWVRSWADVAQVGPREPVVRVSVADNGPGIPESVGARLFDPFVSLKGHGIGLGLTISRSIIESHGGRLWYVPVEDAGGQTRESASGADEAAGAAFHFTLPLRMTPIAE